MSTNDSQFNKTQKNYRLEPPDGGWGFVLTVAMPLMFIIPVTHILAFGIIYGNFLAALGDEASGTSTVNGLFNTVFCIMGLVSNSLFKKYTVRFVGIIGSISFFVGNLSTTFVTTFWQFVITFSILQGGGFGLMLSAMLTTFNEYFTKRKNVMMNVAQTIVAFGSISMPYLLRHIIDGYGFRGTVFILCSLSLHSFLAMLTLQPIKWHLIKVPCSALEMQFLPKENKIKEKNEEIHFSSNDGNIEKQHSFVSKENKSIKKCWNFMSRFLEFSLLKNPVYVNITLGTSFVSMSEIMFVTLLPMFLNHQGYNPNDVVYFMTVYMFADLISRIFQSILTALVSVRSRYLVLGAAACTALFRIVLCLSPHEWLWTIIICALLGFLRSFIQVNVPLVLADFCQETNSSFPAVFGLYQAISALVCFFMGQVASLIATYTEGDIGIHVLFIILILFCVISWSIEMIHKKLKT